MTLKTSSSRSKGQVQGQISKMLESTGKSSGRSVRAIKPNFYCMSLTFKFKVTAKNSVLVHFKSCTAYIMLLWHSVGLKFFIWPRDLERSSSRSRGQVQGQVSKMLEMTGKSSGRSIKPIFMCMTLTFKFKVATKTLFLWFLRLVQLILCN